MTGIHDDMRNDPYYYGYDEDGESIYEGIDEYDSLDEELDEEDQRENK